jgi:dienelactone hydrolase
MRLSLLTALASLFVAGVAEAQTRETITFPSRQKGADVTVPAEIYWPSKTGPVPAMVIHHGSGGVSSEREGRWAREMVAMGLAAVVIDSFKPRGVSSTVEDQSAVTAVDFNLDAMRVLTALGGNARINRAKIGIMGFSKGGTSSLVAAHERQLGQAGVPAGLRYALHVPFYPSCATQYYQPRTSGAPIYMLLGGSDTYVGVAPCQEYAEKLKAAGARVEVKVYPGAMHGFDGGRTYNVPRGENYSQCIFEQKADGSFVERKSGAMVIGTDGRIVAGGYQKAFATCRTYGVSGGAQDAAAAQSMADLKGYVQRHLLGN